MSVKILQLHKRDAYQYKFIQDKYAINAENTVFAIADGTTQSFRSEAWAEILVRNFIDQPTFDSKKLITQFTELAVDFKESAFGYNVNPAIAAIERGREKKGGTSTFIGVKIEKGRNLKFIGCGDSNVFVYRDNDFESFPFIDLDELSLNSSFINTEELILEKISSEYFQQKEIFLKEGEIIILATDALSRLIFKKPECIPELLTLQSFNDLHVFCLKHWDEKRLEEDDITAVIINPDGDSEVLRIIPGESFEFPKAEIYEFNPTVVEPNINQLSMMQMQEINHQFNGVAKDMNAVKIRLKSNSVLLLVCIALLSVNFTAIIYLSNYSPQGKTENDHRKFSTIEQVKDLQRKLKLAEAQVAEYKNKEDNLKSAEEDQGDNGIENKEN
jgi:serine/threonine protein phosphatase PrpC